jgi:hypothetical protein
VTPFHIVVFTLLAFVLLLLFLARRPSQPKPERDDRIRCNICGDRFEDDEVIEREFISGYTYFFCAACVEAIRAEFAARSKKV